MRDQSHPVATALQAFCVLRIWTRRAVVSARMTGVMVAPALNDVPFSQPSLSMPRSFTFCLAVHKPLVTVVNVRRLSMGQLAPNGAVPHGSLASPREAGLTIVPSVAAESRLTLPFLEL